MLMKMLMTTVVTGSSIFSVVLSVLITDKNCDEAVLGFEYSFEDKMSVRRKFIDIGANLADPVFHGFYHQSAKPKHPPDLKHVLTRAFNNGLTRIIITGTSLESSKTAIEIAKTDERLFATVGVHPTHCKEFCENDPDEYTESLKELIRNNSDKVVAFGEFGLDYDRLEFCPAEIQKKYFLHQLNISKEFNLPLFLHMRACDEDFIQYLENEDGNIRGVVHSFDGDVNALNRLLKIGLHIGINGCSMKKDDNLSVIKQIPKDKLLIETDSPWCDIRPSHASFTHVKTTFPSVKREKWNENSMVKSRNEPCNIVQVLEVIAAIREEDPDELAKQIHENTEILFFNSK
ncbi:deoxyribonuclease TATDN1 [Planococcus citri]|uniref:deoxyribonuclease TATDN1 n=1 Tax=Planococcus citri TaxID=170843 RepID=UPI0031F7ECE7